MRSSLISWSLHATNSSVNSERKQAATSLSFHVDANIMTDKSHLFAVASYSIFSEKILFSSPLRFHLITKSKIFIYSFINNITRGIQFLGWLKSKKWAAGSVGSNGIKLQSNYVIVEAQKEATLACKLATIVIRTKFWGACKRDIKRETPVSNCISFDKLLPANATERVVVAMINFSILSGRGSTRQL